MPPKTPIAYNQNSACERLKRFNDHLYYQVLDWKDKNSQLFHQAAPDCDSLRECSEPEILAICILTIQAGLK